MMPAIDLPASLLESITCAEDRDKQELTGGALTCFVPEPRFSKSLLAANMVRRGKIWLLKSDLSLYIQTSKSGRVRSRRRERQNLHNVAVRGRENKSLDAKLRRPGSRIQFPEMARCMAIGLSQIQSLSIFGSAERLSDNRTITKEKKSCHSTW